VAVPVETRRHREAESAAFEIGDAILERAAVGLPLRL